MAEKVVKCGVRKEKGYLYYLDKTGNVARSKMARGGQKGGDAVVLNRCGIRRQPGYLYFIDKDGDVSRAKMARGKKG